MHAIFLMHVYLITWVKGIRASRRHLHVSCFIIGWDSKWCVLVTLVYWLFLFCFAFLWDLLNGSWLMLYSWRTPGTDRCSRLKCRRKEHGDACAAVRAALCTQTRASWSCNFKRNHRVVFLCGRRRAGGGVMLMIVHGSGSFIYLYFILL